MAHVRRDNKWLLCDDTRVKVVQAVEPMWPSLLFLENRQGLARAPQEGRQDIQWAYPRQQLEEAAAVSIERLKEVHARPQHGAGRVLPAPSVVQHGSGWRVRVHDHRQEESVWSDEVVQN